ncbi:hypothetical protein BDW74DRAFT_136529 [Aspergillus multicolor]|uniref:uncharacterized protein n=1 Tax=Aspergillus multicolor TaxID=41759 RepID=UPI003CCD3EB2
MQLEPKGRDCAETLPEERENPLPSGLIVSFCFFFPSVVTWELLINDRPEQGDPGRWRAGDCKLLGQGRVDIRVLLFVLQSFDCVKH